MVGKSWIHSTIRGEPFVQWVACVNFLSNPTNKGFFNGPLGFWVDQPVKQALHRSRPAKSVITGIVYTCTCCWWMMQRGIGQQLCESSYLYSSSNESKETSTMSPHTDFQIIVFDGPYWPSLHLYSTYRESKPALFPLDQVIDHLDCRALWRNLNEEKAYHQQIKYIWHQPFAVFPIKLTGLAIYSVIDKPGKWTSPQRPSVSAPSMAGSSPCNANLGQERLCIRGLTPKPTKLQFSGGSKMSILGISHTSDEQPWSASRSSSWDRALRSDKTSLKTPNGMIGSFPKRVAPSNPTRFSSHTASFRTAIAVALFFRSVSDVLAPVGRENCPDSKDKWRGTLNSCEGRGSAVVLNGCWDAAVSDRLPIACAECNRH